MRTTATTTTTTTFMPRPVTHMKSLSSGPADASASVGRPPQRLATARAGILGSILGAQAGGIVLALCLTIVSSEKTSKYVYAVLTGLQSLGLVVWLWPTSKELRRLKSAALPTAHVARAFACGALNATWGVVILLVALSFAVSEGQPYGLATSSRVLILCVAVALLVAGWVYQRRLTLSERRMQRMNAPEGSSS